MMQNKLVNLLQFALDHDTSDIHLCLRENKLDMQLRVKGKLYDFEDDQLGVNFFRYVLYCANIDVVKMLTPQTGSFEVLVNGQLISLRVAVIQSNFMQSVVIRLLNGYKKLRVADLTYDQDIIKYLKAIKYKKSGLIVFSGPTGSGKTTTLYTILNDIENKKIYTIEDPIEVYTSQYVQLQVNEKQNLNYAEGIKQLMRHDPDIIMIGEIRDSEAAKMAIRCALTGHIVLTSIHAQSSCIAIERLIELGVEKNQLFDVLIGIFNQRLVSLKKSKVGLYEYMDKKEIKYYQKYNQNSSRFISLSQKAKKIKRC